MDQIQSEVVKAVAKVVSIDDVNATDYHKSLLDMGLDSLGTTELATILQTSFGVDLPSTLVFNYPTIADLTNHLNDIMHKSAGHSSLVHLGLGSHREDSGAERAAASCWTLVLSTSLFLFTQFSFGHESRRAIEFSSISCALDIFFPFHRTAVAVTSSRGAIRFGRLY